ncbi:OmpA family protein [Saccharibacillus alkalitolerans]|uniref:OmpA family protein n=1 Tax=Saccharibacillus alkalitolerans TaxID=2705290 RepID=A0ABX0F2I7_9BACL|nr:OmpA family protein [Saccharibacillus alkalitolerans]NGZ75201.1 OmpA family protein [Saccharibacillus alkalitolerans]
MKKTKFNAAARTLALPLATMLILAACGEADSRDAAASDTEEAFSSAAEDSAEAGTDTAKANEEEGGRGTPITPGTPIKPGKAIEPGTPIKPGKAIEPGTPIKPGEPITFGTGDEPVKLEIEDTLLFDYDKAELKPEASKTLDGIVKALKELDGASVEIQGHTDDRGSDDYNLDLSERRAQAVLRYFEESGLENVNFTAAGYGKKQPVASNDTEEGRGRNRRVDLVVAPD